MVPSWPSRARPRPTTAGRRQVRSVTLTTAGKVPEALSLLIAVLRSGGAESGSGFLGSLLGGLGRGRSGGRLGGLGGVALELLGGLRGGHDRQHEVRLHGQLGAGRQ